jgi:hypothetical protein
MKTTTLFLFLILAACGGCATRYDMTLTNGAVITSKGKPHLNADKNMYIFRDVTGRTNAIPAANISQIAPQSMASDDTTTTKKFNPVVNK